MVAVRRTNQLDGDAQPVPGFPHASVQHRRDVERVADDPDVPGLSLELKGRRPRRDAKP